MSLEEFFGNTPKSTFINDYYYRIPLSQPGDARSYVPLGTWSTIKSVLSQSGADAFLAREGRLWDGKGTPSFEEARELLAEGYTLVIRNAQKHDVELAKLAASFAVDFAAPVNVHIYATPAGKSGFGWHYDAEDVFILQSHGVKQYRLRRNTVNPWPLVETIPRDMKFECEVMPLFGYRLAPGDWLYIPPGWWHEARAEEESITLAVGLMSPVALDLLEFLRKKLVSALPWRQRLPTTGTASPLSPEDLVERYQTMFEELGKDLARTLADPEVARAFLASKGIRAP